MFGLQLPLTLGVNVSYPLQPQLVSKYILSRVFRPAVYGASTGCLFKFSTHQSSASGGQYSDPQSMVGYYLLCRRYRESPFHQVLHFQWETSQHQHNDLPMARQFTIPPQWKNTHIKQRHSDLLVLTNFNPCWSIKRDDFLLILSAVARATWGVYKPHQQAFLVFIFALVRLHDPLLPIQSVHTSLKTDEKLFCCSRTVYKRRIVRSF